MKDINTVTIAQTFASSRAVRAALRYLRRKNRDEHPSGNFDNASRWYPSASEKLNTALYRTPSRSWPYSYLLPCRSAHHCAMLEKCANVGLVRSIARKIETSETTEEAITAIRTAIGKSRRAKPAAKLSVAV